MIAQSHSGTDEIAAFSLNILSRIDLSNPRPVQPSTCPTLDLSNPRSQALALAPSRELARRIPGVITHMGQFMEGLTNMAPIPDPSREESLAECALSRSITYNVHAVMSSMVSPVTVPETYPAYHAISRS
ncbi:ATP-dependent RNA helicase [Alternaria alternata]|nr:ATP-dependent RNA helicase [Alternaria alternata]